MKNTKVKNKTLLIIIQVIILALILIPFIQVDGCFVWDKNIGKIGNLIISSTSFTLGVLLLFLLRKKLKSFFQNWLFKKLQSQELFILGFFLFFKLKIIPYYI